MFSAFHYNANRGDKRFKSMYKSGEKHRVGDWNRDLSFEDSISRARNSRHLLVERFRQIQSQLTEDAEDAQQNTTKDEDSSSQDKYSSSNKDIYSSTSKESPPSFKDFGFPSSSGTARPTASTAISTGQSSARTKPRGSVSAFDSNSCEGFDYSSSFKNTLGDNFTFHMDNYNCSTEDLFDKKKYNVDNETKDRLQKVWNNEQNDYNWNWADDEQLLCPGCNQNYMKLKDASLICENCTLQIDLSSSSVTIKMIKEKLKQTLDQHKEKCKERIKYKFKDEKLYIGCTSKNCKKEFYIS